MVRCDLFGSNCRSRNCRGKILTFLQIIIIHRVVLYISPIIQPCLIFFHPSTPQHCDIGCILAESPDNKVSVICAAKQYITISPDPNDNWYRIKISSGFPLGHANDRWTTPQYAQEYAWWEDYGRVSLDGG